MVLKISFSTQAIVRCLKNLMPKNQKPKFKNLSSDNLGSPNQQINVSLRGCEQPHLCSFSLVRVSLSCGEALAGMVRKACRKARRQKVQLAEQPGVLTGVPGLKRALWQPLQTGLVFKSTRKPQICMLFVFQASFPGMWNEMNE